MSSNSDASITNREQTVADLLLEGRTANEVAEELGIAFHTARTHVRNLYRKLGVCNRVEFVNAMRTPTVAEMPS